MTREQLDTIIAKYGLKVDAEYDPHHLERNKFRDLYIGTGQSYAQLTAAVDELRAEGCLNVRITQVNNSIHPQHGQNMIEVGSFWNE